MKKRCILILLALFLSSCFIFLFTQISYTFKSTSMLLDEPTVNKSASAAYGFYSIQNYTTNQTTQEDSYIKTIEQTSKNPLTFNFFTPQNNFMRNSGFPPDPGDMPIGNGIFLFLLYCFIYCFLKMK